MKSILNNNNKKYLSFINEGLFKLNINNRDFYLTKDNEYWYIKYFNNIITKSLITNCYISSIPPCKGWENNNIINDNIFEKLIKYNTKIISLGLFNKWSINNHSKFLNKAKIYVLNIFLILNKQLPPEIIYIILEMINQNDMLK